MIDKDTIQDDEHASGFDRDDEQGTQSFALESVESYPGELPYNKAPKKDTYPTAQKSTVENTEQLDPSLIATLEADIERSRIRKSKDDSLQNSIDNLQKKLNPSVTNEVEGQQESATPVIPEVAADALGSGLKMDDAPAINLEAASDLDLETLDVDLDLPHIQSKPTFKLPQRSRTILIIAAASLTSLVLLGASAWWYLQSRNQPNHDVAHAQATDSALHNPQTHEASPVKSSSNDSLSTSGAQLTDSTQLTHQAVSIAEHGGEIAHSTQPTANSESDKHDASANAHSTQQTEDAHTPLSHGKENKSLKEKIKEQHRSGTVDAKQLASASKQKHETVKAEHSKTADNDGKEAGAKMDSHSKSRSVASTTSIKAKNAKTTALAEPAHETTKEIESVAKHSESPAVTDGHKTPKKEATKSPAQPKTHEPANVESALTKKEVHESAKSSEPTRNIAAHKEPKKKLESATPQESMHVEPELPKEKKQSTSEQGKEIAKIPQYETKLIPKPVFREKAPAAEGEYSVQVYSSPSADDAGDWVRRLRSRNIEGAYIAKQNVRGLTYYRVRFGSFSTRQEAESAALKSGFTSGWIDRIR